MKTSTIIAALTLGFAASGAALAQEATYELPQPVVSTVSRAAVQAELAQARADGTLPMTEEVRNRSPQTATQLSRAEVKEELRAAIARGDVQRLNAESNALPVDRTVAAQVAAAK